jgi:predicted nucleotidyltransferase
MYSIKYLQDKVVKSLTKKITELEFVSIFGSALMVEFDSLKSDIDIAFISSATLTNTQRWNIQEELASELNIDIDLVDLSNANDVIKFEIISKGEVIFKKPSEKLELFLDDVYINYIQLNEDRKEIMELYNA